jgi:hypothetical protein
MPLTLRSAPRISAAQFSRVLERFNSPCAPIAQECYQIIAAAGLDPAVGLAFFAHESVFGTRGKATETKNWGNVRAPFKAERAVGKHPKNFAIYATWQDGLMDWCERINERYINQRGLDTVEKAIPVYAPSFDGNVPQSYIEHVTKLVTQWIEEDGKQRPPVPVKTPPDTSSALRNDLLKATFAAVGATYRPETAMHRYMLAEARAGRPLGNPVGEMKQVKLNGQDYVIQVFALDTIYSPVQRWSEVYRLSDLLKKEPQV